MSRPSPSACTRAREEVDRVLGPGCHRREQLLEALHALHDAHGHLDPDSMAALAERLGLSAVEVYEVASFYHHFDIAGSDDLPPEITVRVCDSITCKLFGAGNLARSLATALPDVRIQHVPCIGRCAQAPAVMVRRRPVAPATVDAVQDAISSGDLEESPPVVPGLVRAREQGAYGQLLRLHAGEISPEEVLRTLERSGLPGLGGAGFPAGRKWKFVLQEPAPRYLAVNIDEGEPGTFKDRILLERSPHPLFEGMLIAARVIGAEAIYLYVRDEYPGIRRMLSEQIEALREEAPVELPRIELRRGAGSYVCGEESAMIESIEGRRGQPRLRPPYLAQRGLFGRPTLAHNMETLYRVPQILEKGADWYLDHGDHGRHGLRSYSLSGRVCRPGLYEAPAGITARCLIEEYGGGMADGHSLYGYFPGGAAGGILPASLADVPLDFGTLEEHGCFLGSGAVIVLSDQDRARDAASCAMDFFVHESCGKCTPCRVGTERAARLMRARRWDATLMEELSEVMRDSSICGLGQAAPNPMQSVLRHFPSEVS